MVKKPDLSYTLDPLNPNPAQYPVCGTCGVPYVLRLSSILRTNSKNRRDNGWYHQWLWQRDCKHKKNKPEVGKLDARDIARIEAQARAER